MGTEENKALVRRWFEETDRHNFAILDELLAEDYVDHNPPFPDLPGGREGVRRANEMLLAAFPDATHVIEDQLAEGDRAATRWTARGTHTGEVNGVPPTGKKISVDAISIHRMAGGRIAETWEVWDTLGFLQQIGVVPAS